MINDQNFDWTNNDHIRTFRKMIYSYYRQHGRDHLPWRTDFNPYHIYISEVMLQQTQVDRVISKFVEFTERFDSFQSLANANLEDVLGMWKGLGYNRRAAALRNAAQMIVEKFDGLLPDSPEALKILPGIGSATAASICAFAFDKPVIFLETNIRTVLIYHFLRDQAMVEDTVLFSIADKVIDRKNPRKWYSAIMDYGSMLKKNVGNESKKSTGYKKQSTFKGSRRELRGKILKHLLDYPLQSSEKIAESLNYECETVSNVLEQLVNEKMVRSERGKYRIGE